MKLKKYKFQKRLLNEYVLNLPKPKVLKHITDTLDDKLIKKLKFKIVKEEDDSESADEYGATLFTIVAVGNEKDIKLFKKEID